MKVFGKALVGALAVALASMSHVKAQTRSDAWPDDNPKNWPMYHRDFSGSRHSPLREITTANVKDLHVAWLHQPGVVTQGLQVTPLAVDGVIYYIGSGNRVFALDGATGREIWHYYPQLDDVANEVFFTPYSRGIALGHGRVYIGTLDGRGIALDAKTGKEVWQLQLTKPRECGGCNFTSPPVVAGDMLVFGPTGGDLPNQGKIYGVDTRSGKLAWSFETLRDAPESWGGDSRRFGGGGAWMTGSFDPATHTVFFGTGNPAPDYDWGAARPGDNLYTSSVIALDPDTGKLKWYHQEVPHDVWDFDSSTGEFLFVERAGKRQIVHYNKGGFVFIYDPAGGAIQNVWKFAENVNWVDRIDPETGALINPKPPKFGEKTFVCPWLLGAKSWNHGSYNPGTGLWYVNAMEACDTVEISKGAPESVPLSALYYGGTSTAVNPPNEPAYGHLDARDPLTGEKKWEVRTRIPMLSSVLTTGGNLVFVGDLQGNAHAYDGANGQHLWQFNMGSGVRGGPISYEAGGHQYVLYPSGIGSNAIGFFAQLWPEVVDYPAGAALVAFRLN
jgi:alcohol dehydrogenase (cytochrome c)